jgi:MFS family permease
VAFAVVSFAVYAGNVIANSLRQSLSPRDLMGRVGSAWRGIVWGAIPIGSLIGGALAVHGLRLPLIIAGVAQCVVAIALAGPLTRSLAASERAEAAAEGAQPPRIPIGRRLHSRPGRGPLYWGRSSRSSRR